MSSTSIEAPAGWMPAHLAGADLVTLPLNVDGRGNPTLMVSGWDAEGSPVAVPDPREDTGLEGLAVARDPWRGGAWSGLRFLRLSRSRSGRPVAEIRWLLWSARVPRADQAHGDPALDVTATCDLSDLLLLEPVFDGMATGIPADFSPRMPAGTPTRQERFPLQYEPLGGPGASTGADTPTGPIAGPSTDAVPERWRGTGLVPVASSVVDTLRGTDPARAWGRLDRETARPVIDAGLSDEDGTRLSERAAMTASILQNPEQSSTLVVTDSEGTRTALTLARHGGLVVVLVPALDDGADARIEGHHDDLLGLYPVERSAEMVVRSAGLGPSDPRPLDPATVSRASLVRRALDPSLPLPSELCALGDDPAETAAAATIGGTSNAWPEVWSGHWALWTLTTDGHPPLVVLTSGRTGSYALLTSEDGDGNTVRLAPVPTSSLFTALLARLCGPLRKAEAV